MTVKFDEYRFFKNIVMELEFRPIKETRYGMQPELLGELWGTVFKNGEAVQDNHPPVDQKLAA